MKDKNKKSFMDVVHEVDQQEAEERQKLREKYKEQEEKNRLEHENQLKQDKIELLKEKQGVFESEEVAEEKVKTRTFKEKVGDFFYHNKWWLGLAVIAVALATFLTCQLLSREKYDLAIMMITDDEWLQSNSSKVEDFFAQYCEDYNKDGKVEVTVYCLPINDEAIAQDYTRGISSSINAQLQMGEVVLVLSDDYGNNYIDSDNTLYNLEDDFSDCDEVKGTNLYLSDTIFTDEIGYEGEMDDDICLGIRAVSEKYSFKKKMQKKFNQAYPIIEKIINDMEADEK